jgi:hypothetical protein
MQDMYFTIEKDRLSSRLQKRSMYSRISTGHSGTPSPVEDISST